MSLSETTPATRSPRHQLRPISVAIVLTAFNQSSYTKQAVHSLLSTTSDTNRYAHTFAVFDDCSTDDTEAVVRTAGAGRVDYWRSPQNLGVTHLWNQAYRHFCTADYLVLANNDVLFSRDWCTLLLDALRAGNKLIGGPVSNCPGHAPWQDVRNFLPDYEPSSRAGDISTVSGRLARMEAFTAHYVNGFCMALDLQLLRTAARCWDGAPFDPGIRDIGNEDEFQRRVGAAALVVPQSFVFHYKRVTLHSSPTKFSCYRQPWPVSAELKIS